MKLKNTGEALEVTNSNLANSVFDDVNLQGASFNNVNLSKSTFADINFSGSRFDNLNFTQVEIGACDTTGMKIRGILVSDLFEAYRRQA
ncbi:MAG: pentapeptide repeat-containing protein [Verrucomicrobia bacterium]|nr:pentapeptide repeat-containing protein [Verrucomicrobiota bacterium]